MSRHGLGVTTNVPGPTALSARTLGPDLARGFMLLFIALANSHYFVRGDAYLGGFPDAGSAADAGVTWLISTFVDGRAYPMFGLLFGYGVAHIVARQRDARRRSVRRLLWRRSVVLIVVGVLDGLLLYVGDVLTMYGVLLLVGAWVVFWKDRWLLAIAAVVFAFTSLPSAEYPRGFVEGPDASMLPPDLATMLSERAAGVAVVALLGPIGFACPFLVGLWAGRHRVLDDPGRHRRLLVVVATVGIAVGSVGAQPVALLASGGRPMPGDSTLELFGALHAATGVLGGFGYAALITLVAQWIGDRRGPLVEALAATGQRSMTCYLLQSVTWAVVFTPFLLDLSATLTIASTAMLATLTWLASVALADRMRRRGQRGPFEVLVRRVTYGRRGLSNTRA